MKYTESRLCVSTDRVFHFPQPGGVFPGPTRMKVDIKGVIIRRPTAEEAPAPCPAPRRAFPWGRALALFLTWLVLSGQFDAFHLGLGAVCSLLVAVVSADIFPRILPTGNVLLMILRSLVFVPWLTVQILKANFWMLYLVFHPRMSKVVNPRIVRFHSRLQSVVGRTVLANCITLTPGTVTISVDERGYMQVHTIDDRSAQDLPGKMEQMVAWFVGEDI